MHGMNPEMIFGGDIVLSPDLMLLVVLGSVGLFFVVLRILDRRRD